ncbi:MAG: hypothetical protein ACTSVL_03265, partial [Promethearchaeota archaeon]
DDGTPNFEKMSSEYDGLGEELEEEDAMLAALEELDFDSGDKNKQKSKKKMDDKSKNPFLL